MLTSPHLDGPAPSVRFRAFTQRNLDQIPQLQHLSAEDRFAIRVVAQVLPFRVNQYVLDHLIDWERAPDDPMFRLVFPQREMLTPADFRTMADLLLQDADAAEVTQAARAIQRQLNPHPAGQTTLNRPVLNEQELDGLQHKYRETLLFFPNQGQTCHSYCTFCFRWAQFVKDKELRIGTSQAGLLQDYLREHQEITDLLVTGGDPMVMKTSVLREYLQPLLHVDFDHVQTIRLGTKSLTFWPHRFVTDPDADEVLQLLNELVAAGKHVAIMAHFEHGREFSSAIAHTAIRRIRATGAVIRTQAPVLRKINDRADIWTDMWREQVKLGMVPYYMFVERDTGARQYFELPLVEALQIYQQAIRSVSGLARTARGPSMSAQPGKVEIQGVAEIGGQKAFVLRFLQARDPELVQQPFFARFDPQATWFDQLRPLPGSEPFFPHCSTEPAEALSTAPT